MKKLLLGLMLLITACQQPQPVYVQQPPPMQSMQPDVSFGYYNGAYSAHVIDQTGSYVMDYMLFQQLMDQGGYNTVSQYYWGHPGNAAFHPWTGHGWRAYNTPASLRYHNLYTSSYGYAYRRHNIYRPNKKVINNVSVVNNNRYHPAPSAPTAPAATNFKPLQPMKPRLTATAGKPLSVYRPSPRLSAYKSSTPKLSPYKRR